jgi:hypothetical protein
MRIFEENSMFFATKPLSRPSLFKPSVLSVCFGIAFASHVGTVAAQDATNPKNNIGPGITRIEISSVSPAFGGKSFGKTGAYERVIGKAYGELDPNDPRNLVITDLKLAPTNARGRVEYSMDIYILRPADPGKGNHKLFMEVNNRGGKLFSSFNLSGAGNDPGNADPGDAFLMDQGYTLAWNGWDPSAPVGNYTLNINVPVAKNRDGSTITGPSYEYIEFDNATTKVYALSYPTATRDKSQARLTVRQHLTDVATIIPDSGWDYGADGKSIVLAGNAPFQQSAIYEFTYTAKDPVVAGIGFAATRDFVSFLRYSRKDAYGNSSPVGADLNRAYAFTISQPGRYMNDFVWLGFNEGGNHHKVFDGVENWIAAGTGDALNVRFAQPGRTERNRQNHLYAEGFFPFAYTPLSDPLTGKTDGRNARCDQSDTCPKIMSVNSANEYWVKTGSLVHSTVQGRDLPDPWNVRFYLLSGLEHTVSGAPPSAGVCQQVRNTTDPNPALRALFVALDAWVDENRAPPASRVPRVSEGTAVFVHPTSDYPVGVGRVQKSELGWPDIPGVTYTGVVTVRNVWDFGGRFAQGILDVNPPQATGKIYPSFVSKVDADGNEVAGVRLPPVAAPVATTTGWGLRAAPYGGPDGCESSGQSIPFATTQSERLNKGDPRLSLAERYGDHGGYVSAVAAAANKLMQERLLLPEDVKRYIHNAQVSNVLN